MFCIRDTCTLKRVFENQIENSFALLYLLYENCRAESLWSLRREFIHVIHTLNHFESERMEDIFSEKKKKQNSRKFLSSKIIEPDKLCPSTTRLYISKKTRIKIQERSSANRLLKYTDMENALYQTLLAGNHCKTILPDPLAT